jgi:hypothetical protein
MKNDLIPLLHGFSFARVNKYPFSKRKLYEEKSFGFGLVGRGGFRDFWLGF